MDILGITFQAVAALLGIGILGFWILGRRHVPAELFGFLNALAIDIALPCLVLANILNDFSPQKFPDWWRMPLWWIGFTLVALALSLIASFISKKETRGEFAMSLFYQNGIFFPLVILTGLFGRENPYLVLLFLFIFLHPSMVFSVYSLFFGKKAQLQKLSWKRIVNPVLVTTVAGMFITLIGIRAYVPDFLVMIFVMVGVMANPLFMLILGGNVYNDFRYKGEGANRFYTWEVVKFVLVKNIIFPLVFLALLIFVRPDYGIALIILLQAAVPPITAIPILAERCGGNRVISGQYIVSSFIFSIISIPAVIYLFSIFFPFPDK
jgi:predicted permease